MFVANGFSVPFSGPFFNAIESPPRSPNPRRLASPVTLSPAARSPAGVRANNGLSAVQALLGPLSPHEAPRVLKEWRASTPRALKLTDPAKGLERQGRKVARSLNASQFEYWEFLDAYCDLSSADGLRLLDNYLHDVSRRLQEERQREVDNCHNDDGDVLNGNVPDILSPMSQLARDLGELRLSSTPVKRQDNGNESDSSSSGDSSSTFLSFPLDRTAGSETSFETADEGTWFYMKGARPSLADAQVFDALQDSGLTTECVRPFPCVSAWMTAVASAGEEERRAWRKFSSTATRREINSVPKLLFDDDSL